MPPARAGLLELKRVSKLQSAQANTKSVKEVDRTVLAYFNTRYYPEHHDFMEYIRTIVNWGDAADPDSVARLNSLPWREVKPKKYLAGHVQRKLLAASLAFIKQRSEAEKAQKLALAFMVSDFLTGRTPKLIDNVDEVTTQYEEEVNIFLDTDFDAGNSQEPDTMA